LDKLSVLSCRLVSVNWKLGTESYVREEINKVPPVRTFRTRFGDLKTLKNFLNSGTDLVTPNVTFGFNPTFPIVDTDLVLFFEKFGKRIKSLRIENSSNSGTVALPPIVITEMEAWITKNVQKNKEGFEIATIPVEVHEQFDENGNVLQKKGQIEKDNDNAKDNRKDEDSKEFRTVRAEKIYEEIGERLEDSKSNCIVNPNFGKGIDLQMESIGLKQTEESPVYATPMKKKLPAIPDVSTSEVPVENDASSSPSTLNESVAIQIPPETAEEEEARQKEDNSPAEEPENKKEIKRFKLSDYIQVKFINDAAARKVLANPDYLPVPYDPAGYTEFADFYPYYLGRHFDSRNRRLHILGTTGSLIFFLLGLVTLTPVLFLVGILQRCICIWTGHYFFEEGNKALQNPVKNSLYSVS